jgi:tetratricopeptide (TPR) repeat protein
MPRPSKHVSPDTLGGRLRAAREHLHLSLADVANGHYSTSLISQIERNRIEPSQESLRFLADRLQLSLEDLEVLAQQHRDTEVGLQQYKSYEELRIAATQLLNGKDPLRAMQLLEKLHFPQVPSAQRWRLAALRGQCYFEQRKFLKAQQDFVYAVNEHPRLEGMNGEQKYEYLLLQLHLAGTYRELQQLDAALEHYKSTLQLINRDTPFGYVAEVHWGMALIAFAQAHRLSDSASCRESQLRLALEHAENARFLYRAIGEHLRAATVTCQIAQIEQALGQIEKVCQYLEEILTNWSFVLQEPPAMTSVEKHRQQEAANIVSSAACALAGIKLEERDYEKALKCVKLAQDAGRRSYKLRRAEAFIMHGRILEALDLNAPAAEEAFRQATEELHNTHRISARIGAHVRFGRHLLKKGKIEEGEQELERARQLSDLVSASNGSSHLDDIPLA